MAPAQQSNPDGVVKIGKGRGFVIESQTFMVGRVIVTAAHCLPRWPPRHGASRTEERTFVLLGPFDAAPTIPVECLLVDPVADIAVLGEPDGQASEELRSIGSVCRPHRQRDALPARIAGIARMAEARSGAIEVRNAVGAVPGPSIGATWFDGDGRTY